jgi:signal transduction histidine kinase
LTNALKYRALDRPLKINIDTYEEGEYYVFSIRDNGLGLNQRQQSKLFTMFKRMHTHVDGSGIGLYIIKRIIENNGGKITLESEIDKGSTFKAYIGKHTKNGKQLSFAVKNEELY